MAEKPSPALVKFIRRSVRRDPQVSVEEVLEQWRLQRGGAVEGDAEAVRTVYEEEHEIQRRGPPPRVPDHGRHVMLTIAAWVGLHALLLALIGGTAYLQCASSAPSSGYNSCGIDLGLTALAIGWLQLLYGVIVAAVLSTRSAAIAQGLFIGTAAVTLSFTVLCFGAAANLR